jgi:hypothetical protein
LKVIKPEGYELFIVTARIRIMKLSQRILTGESRFHLHTFKYLGQPGLRGLARLRLEKCSATSHPRQRSPSRKEMQVEEPDA